LRQVPEAEHKKSNLRRDVLEANAYARIAIDQYKLEFIDLHYYFNKQTHRRAKDGIHWDCTTHRRITNIFLNHMCLAWNKKPPGRLLILKNPDVFIQDNREDHTESYDSNFATTDESNFSCRLDLPPDLREKIEIIKRLRLDDSENNEPGEIPLRETNPVDKAAFQFFQQNPPPNTYFNSSMNMSINQPQMNYFVPYTQFLPFNYNNSILDRLQPEFSHILSYNHFNSQHK
jgi:hypothetical protein